MAMQGLAVVPLFAGFDLGAGAGRIFSYDVTGGRYEEHSFHAVGSGSVFARSALKKRYRDDVDRGRRRAARRRRALRRRGRRLRHRRPGPDPADLAGRHDASRDEGLRRLPEDEVGAVVQAVVDERMTNPGG